MKHLSKKLSFLGLMALVSCTSLDPSTSSDPAAMSSGPPNAQMQAVLDQLNTLGPKPIETLTPAEARTQPSASDAGVQLIQVKGIVAPDKLPPVGKVKTIAIPGPEGQPLRLRVYTPPGDGPFPISLYFHGGGWVIANLDTYDASCRAICSLSGSIVVSVDYRLAPEHPFPAAPEDGYTALQHVFQHGREINGDPARVAVVGESAGGNLATVVALMAKQRGTTVPLHQALIYPITNYAFDTESYRENAKAKPLNAAMMQWFFKHYLKSPSDGQNVLVSPLRATDEQLRGLPEATIVTAEIDPLRDDGKLYADRLRKAGVAVQHRDFTGVTHEFFGMGLVVDDAKSAETFVAGRLKQSFANSKR